MVKVSSNLDGRTFNIVEYTSEVLIQPRCYRIVKTRDSVLRAEDYVEV